jgi:Glycosyltransferase family 87
MVGDLRCAPIADNGTVSTSRTARRRVDPWLAAGAVLAIVMWVLVIAWSDPSVQATQPWNGQPVTAQDARSYYGFNYLDLYAGRTDWNTVGAYPYSPAFAQLLFPLNLLPWPLFVAVWTGVLLAAVWFLTGPDYLLLGLVVGAMEIAGGNVSLLLALAIVRGFRHPWAWSFVLLTKITPGVGLLWFALRREWRQLAVALGASAAIVAVSYVLMPEAWRDWVDLLGANTSKGGTWAAIPIPLLVRGPTGVLLIAWGARRDHRWTVPVGAMLALPALWYGSLSMLLAMIPLTTPAERARAWARLTGRASRDLAA